MEKSADEDTNSLSSHFPSDNPDSEGYATPQTESSNGNETLRKEVKEAKRMTTELGRKVAETHSITENLQNQVMGDGAVCSPRLQALEIQQIQLRYKMLNEIVSRLEIKINCMNSELMDTKEYLERNDIRMNELNEKFNELSKKFDERNRPSREPKKVVKKHSH